MRTHALAPFRHAAMFLNLALLLASMLRAGSAGAAPANVLLDHGYGSPETCTSPGLVAQGARQVAVWSEMNSSSASENRMYYAVSTDSGATFTAPEPLPQYLTTLLWRWNRESQLALDPATGSVFVAGLANATSGAGVLVMKGSWSGTTFSWGTPVLALSPGSTLGGVLSLAVAPFDHSVHLLYVSQGRAMYTRNADGNIATWSVPVRLSSTSDSGAVILPRLAAPVSGTTAELHAAWLGARSGSNAVPIRYRKSADAGLTWAAEQTPASMQANPAMPFGLNWAPGGGSSLPPGFSMAVNGIPSSSTFGRVALAWCETWVPSPAPFPPLTSTTIHHEVEPNDALGQEQSFSIGDAIDGTSSSLSDVDLWRFTLTAGNSIELWADSSNVATSQMFALLDATGFNYLLSGPVGGGAGPLAVMTFRAPVSGSYYVRMPGLSANPGSYYRLRTRFASPPGSGARDQRDLAVAYSTGAGWSSVVRPDLSPPGYEDFLPTIGFGADGLDYVTWYDFTPGGGSAHAHLAVARNLAGADPVISTEQFVTNSPSIFDSSGYVYYQPPGIGPGNSIHADPDRLGLAWVDARDGYQAAMGASLPTQAYLTSCAGDTALAPGATATLRPRLLNRNPLFEEKALVTVSDTRGWFAPYVVRDSMPPGSSGLISIPVHLPDSARVADTVTLTIRRQSGIVLGSCSVTLTPLPTTDVAGAAPTFHFGAITPNPSPGVARLDFSLPQATSARVAIYGVAGNLVRSLAGGMRPAGPQSLFWDGLDDGGHRAAPGIYLVRLQAAGRSATRRLAIVR